ncbi:MAG: DUF4838 domain-containing protein [Clostridia bacterium]|nr:DUF4838 domain-containing protein [Clostridia bacterium]
MKKAISVFLTALIILSCFSTAVSAVNSEEVTVVSKDEDVTVAIPENSTYQQRYAADYLKRYIQKITGAQADISTDTQNADIIIDAGYEAPESTKNGAYLIYEDGGKIFISGSGRRGTPGAVIAFLKKVCSCRWYAQDLEVIPQADEITVQKGLRIEYTPYFEYMETDWGYTPEDYRILNDVGGKARYIPGFAHTLTNVFCSAGEYFDSHPEYFALHGNKRTPNQLCLTNPDVVSLVTNQVLDLLKNNYDPDGPLLIVSVTQHDNQDYCECENCASLDNLNGSHAGTMVTFANTIADAVKAAGYTNAAIDTFAYQYTRKAPTAVVPRDNVIIRLCDIECCFGHTLDNPKCAENASFMADLKAWSKICERIYIWDYVTNFGESFNFFANFNALQRDMQIFYENNVKGVFGEGSGYVSRCNGEFCDLRAYLECCLLADPYMDFDAEMNGFLEAYYGDGWENIRRFIDICTEKGCSDKYHVGIFERSKGSLPGMKNKDVTLCDELWQNAKDLAGDEETLERVLRSEICWRYWKCSNRKGEFSFFRSLYSKMNERDKLYNDIISRGNDLLGEPLRKREISKCQALHLLRIPFCWSNLYEEDIWFFLDPYVISFYQFLGKIHSFLGF